MPLADLLPALLAAAVILAVVPGPAMLYIAARTLAGGRNAGLMAALGIHLGGYIHVAAAALGLSFALHNAPEFFILLKFVGAGYLAWLGVTLFRNKGSVAVPKEVDRTVSDRRAFIESVAVEALNPATAIFFMTFLPLFVDPSSGIPLWVQFVLLGALTNLILSAAEIIVVLMAGTLTVQLRRQPRSIDLMQRVAGSVLMVLALHMGLG